MVLVVASFPDDFSCSYLGAGTRLQFSMKVRRSSTRSWLTSRPVSRPIRPGSLLYNFRMPAHARHQLILVELNSFLLTFALAEQEEIRQNKAVARTAYEDLIKNHGAEIDKLKKSINEEVDEAKGPEIEDDEVEFLRADDEDMDGAELSETQKRKMEREARGKAVVDRRQKELDDLVTAAGVIWIMYMRFARRTEVGPISHYLRRSSR